MPNPTFRFKKFGCTSIAWEELGFITIVMKKIKILGDSTLAQPDVKKPSTPPKNN